MTERLFEWARVYTSEGLHGSERREFKEWLADASDEEKEVFAAAVDSAALVSLAGAAEQELPPELKGEILGALEDPQEKERLLPEPGAFSYLLESEGEWVPLPVPGARVKELSAHEDDGVTVFLLEMDRQTRFPSHHHHGVEMAYVLEGDLRSGDRHLKAGDFMRAGAETEHAGLYSEGGCRALLITAQENYPRRTVGMIKRARELGRTVLSLLGGGK